MFLTFVSGLLVRIHQKEKIALGIKKYFQVYKQAVGKFALNLT